MNNIPAYLSILWPAMIAGILVLLSHVPLGQQVLKRGIVFIDLAIAQVAGLGVIAAHTVGFDIAGWTTQIAAVGAALLGSLLLTWTEKKRPEAQEALIGILFVLASTAQLLLLSNDPHGGEDLKDLLAGQILWVSKDQLIRAGILTAIFLVAWFAGASDWGASASTYCSRSWSRCRCSWSACTSSSPASSFRRWRLIDSHRSASWEPATCWHS